MQIMRLLESAAYVHLHADWSNINDWVDAPGSRLFLRNDELKGYVAATLDPPPVAWVRALGVAMHNPQRALDELFSSLLVPLREQGADRLACMAVQPWVDHELVSQGFEHRYSLSTMVKADMTIPDLPHVPVSIRPVDSAEFHAVAAIDQAAFADPLWWHSALQLERGAQNALQFDVAFAGQYPVGFAYGLRASRQEAHLVRIAVAPTHHGQGIGAALLAHAIGQYRLHGMERVTLNTQLLNDAALRLYRRFGFEMSDKRYAIWERFL